MNARRPEAGEHLGGKQALHGNPSGAEHSWDVNEAGQIVTNQRPGAMSSPGRNDYSGTAMKASPARTTIGIGRSTQPPSPTVAVLMRLSLVLFNWSNANTDIRWPLAAPSR